MSLFPLHPDARTPRIHYLSPQTICRHAGMVVALLATLLVTACKEPTTGVGITGIDHLPEYMSVQRFYVDGYDASRAGGGGATVCCALLPNRWRPDLTVEIRWNVTNWRDCDGREYVRRVPVQAYEQPGRLWVHFLADGSIRAVSSGIGPGSEAYPGPHEPIPSKEPWDVYPIEAICEAKRGAKPAADSKGRN